MPVASPTVRLSEPFLPVNDSTDSQHGKAEINTLRLRREGDSDEKTADLSSRMFILICSRRAAQQRCRNAPLFLLPKFFSSMAEM